MISAALRFPFDAATGRAHFLGTTGALLATAILLRLAVELYPLVLVLVPLVGAFVSTSIAAGICVEAFLRPDQPLDGVRALLRTGAVAVGVTAATLLLPLLLLVWTVISWSGGDSGTGSGLGLFFLLGSTASIVTFLAATYVLPALVARVVDGGIGSITTGRPLRTIVTEVSYLQGWGVGFSLATLGGWVAVTGLASRTFVGLLSILFGAYCFLAGVRAIGTGYAAVPGIESGS